MRFAQVKSEIRLISIIRVFIWLITSGVFYTPICSEIISAFIWIGLALLLSIVKIYSTIISNQLKKTIPSANINPYLFFLSKNFKLLNNKYNVFTIHNKLSKKISVKKDNFQCKFPCLMTKYDFLIALVINYFPNGIWKDNFVGSKVYHLLPTSCKEGVNCKCISFRR